MFRADDPLPGDRGVREEDAPGRVADALDRERLREHTARAERRERIGEIDEAHLAATEREREAVARDVVEGREPEAMGDLEHRVEADRVEGAHGRHIERRRERDPQRDDAVE